MKYYGAKRVIEPRDVIPETAWQLNADKCIGSLEARMSVEKIHIERDSFQQLCNSCNYDEAQLRNKIMDLVEKRGKLHNPFTHTGGALVGTVEEVADDMTAKGIRPGDRIFCASTLCGIPLHLDHIGEIDFNYGMITCSGYCIIFESTIIAFPDEEMEEKYELAAVDESNSIFAAYDLIRRNQSHNVCIMSNSIYTALVYSAAARKGDPHCSIEILMPREITEDISHEEIISVLSDFTDSVYFIDFSQSISRIRRLETILDKYGTTDMTIIGDHIFGAETLGSIITRENGILYFATIRNNYTSASFTAETLGKLINIYVFDQCMQDQPGFSRETVRSIQDRLIDIDKRLAAKAAAAGPEGRHYRVALYESNGSKEDFIYQSPVTGAMIEETLNIAHFDCNVIIQGETGVGKEKVLSLIHQNSERCNDPCIKINCATISESLAESEFFGYDEGAFTGASAQGKKGYFELANNGILFLDEIGALSLNMQSKLLRVLQENSFYRVGGSRQISVNVRVIAANNIPLIQLVEDGVFRSDLYYRLNICTIEVPPLRNRRDDILCLSEWFVRGLNKRYGTSLEIAPEALKVLFAYDWPGNVRELENIIHKLVINCSGRFITAADVENTLLNTALSNSGKKFTGGISERAHSLNFNQIIEGQERQLIEYALEKCGTTRKAAEFLGMSRSSFDRKRHKYGL